MPPLIHHPQIPQLQFSRALSACVRECFNRMEHMDTELRTRLVKMLSYQLSNFEYQWPWNRCVGTVGSVIPSIVLVANIWCTIWRCFGCLCCSTAVCEHCCGC